MTLSEKILLILDLDETLIHATKKDLGRMPDFKVFGYNIHKRPHLETFLNGIKDHFEIAVWSSASDDYVEGIVKIIFPYVESLKFVWGRTRCTYRSNKFDEFKGEVDHVNDFHYIKRLDKVKKRGQARMEKLLIVDDTPQKVKNSFGNAIYIKEFQGENEDAELLHLLEYLLSIKDAENVRTIEKRFWRSGFGN